MISNKCQKFTSHQRDHFFTPGRIKCDRLLNLTLELKKKSNKLRERSLFTKVFLQKKGGECKEIERVENYSASLLMY